MERFAAMPVRRGPLARLAVVLSVAAVACRAVFGAHVSP